MSRELLQKCLARMYGSGGPYWADDLCAEIRAALAQKEPEPIAWAMLRADGLVLDVICPDEHNDVYEGAYTVPLYSTPQPAPAAPISWDRLRILMDGIPTREEFIGGQRQQYVAKEAVMGWLYEGQLRAEREAAQSAAPAVPLTDTRKLCTCDGAGRGPGRACVVQAGGRLGDLWKCAKAPAPAVREPLPHTRLFELLQEVDPLAVRLPSGWERWARVIERAHGIGDSK